MIDERDRKKAYQMAGIITRFDRLVFPDNPIKRIEIILVSPVANKKGVISWVRYDYGKPEHYDIFVPGLCAWLQLQLTGEYRTAHIAFIEQDWGKIKEEDILWLTEEELWVAISAHEVRHRLQRCLKPPLFSRKNLSQIPTLRVMGRILAKRGNRGKEFDAKVIEYLAAKEFHLGNDQPDDIASIIKKIPKDFSEGP